MGQHNEGQVKGKVNVIYLIALHAYSDALTLRDRINVHRL